MNPEIKKAFEKYVGEQTIPDHEFEKRKLEYINNQWSPNTLSLKNSTLEEQSINIITKYLYFHEFDEIPYIRYAANGINVQEGAFITKREKNNGLLKEIRTYMGGGDTDEINSEIYFIKELLQEDEDFFDKKPYKIHEISEEEAHILEKRLLQIKADEFKNLFKNTIGDGVVKKSTGFLSKFFK